MNCFIVKRDGTGLKNVRVAEYSLPLDLMHNGNASIVGNINGYDGGLFISFDFNYVWHIGSASPSNKENKTEFRLESILYLFDREINTDGLDTSTESAFLNSAINKFETDGDSFLQINGVHPSINGIEQYFPPKLSEYGTFNLKKYIEELINSNYIKITVSVGADGKSAVICSCDWQPKTLVMNKGKNILQSETQSKNAISAITNYVKDENDEYTNTTYYLFDDGTFSIDPTDGNRITGKWVCLNNATIDDVSNKFSSNEYSHKITFKDSAMLQERQRVKLLMDGGRIVNSIVTGITATNKENVFSYECGTLKTKLTDFLGGVLRNE